MICRHQPNSSTAQFRGRLIVKVALITPEGYPLFISYCYSEVTAQTARSQSNLLTTHLIKTKNYGNNEGNIMNNFDVQLAYYVYENFSRKPLSCSPPKRHHKIFSNKHHSPMSSL